MRKIQSTQFVIRYFGPSGSIEELGRQDQYGIIAVGDEDISAPYIRLSDSEASTDFHLPLDYCVWRYLNDYVFRDKSRADDDLTYAVRDA